MTIDSPAETTVLPPARGSGEPWPSPARAWYAVFVFSLALMINFLDRGIVALLMPAMQKDLQLTDIEMSYLVGFAFILIYVFIGLPVARYADVGPRRAIVGIGIGLWSLATAFCGLAQNFWQIFACRVATGLGESCGGPATYSMLSDLFPREKLTRAIAVMSFGFMLGQGLSMVIGGGLLKFLESIPPWTLPYFGTLRPWQMSFLVVGIPGLVVAAMLWTVKEPKRRGREMKGAKLQSAPIMTVVRFLWTNRRLYGAMLLGLALNSLHAIGTLLLAPTFYLRTYGWNPAEVVIYSGIILLIVWPPGAMFGSWLAERFQKQGKDDANLRVVAWALFLLIPGQVLFPLMPSGELALAVNGLNGFVAAWVLGPQNAAVQVVTPNEMRGQITALVIFMINIFGFGLGVWVVALTTTYVFGAEEHLRYSLALVNGVLGVPATLAIIWAMKPYAEALRRARKEWG